MAEHENVNIDIEAGSEKKDQPPIIVLSVKIAESLIEAGHFNKLYRIGRNLKYPKNKVWYFYGDSDVRECFEALIQEARQAKEYRERIAAEGEIVSAE